VIVGYAVVAGAGTAWRYMVITSAVGDALAEERRLGSGDRAARVRQAVLRGANDAGLSLDPEEVTAVADGNVVTVQVRHVYTVVEYQARRLDIPITVERSSSYP
jgi:hypothetical protein